MYAGMYFVHIMGLAIWFGALLVGVLLLRSARAHVDQQQVAVALANRSVWTTLQAAAVAVLLSGIGMIIQAGLLGQSKPLWLKLMEEGGGMVVLVFVVFVSIWTRKLRNVLKQGDVVSSGKMIKRFIGLSVSFVLAIATVVLIVSLRLT